MINKSTKLILALKKIPHIGNVTILKALFGLPKSRISDSFNFVSHLNIERLTKNIKNGVFTEDDWNALLKSVNKYLIKLRENHIHVIDFLSNDYPLNLKLVKNKRFPVILYVKGNLKILNERSIAIVGTREPSNFGTRLTKKYAEYFVHEHYIVIAGLALGTDTNAHKATVESGGKTVAILAEGLDQPVYPRRNTNLAKKILATGGALVSEYPLGMSLQPQYLVERDKWQSGIADGVIAVESGIKGGTKHAMYNSQVQGRPLGVPDYKKYSDYFNINYSKLLNKSLGTQEYINKGLAYPLYTGKSVYKFEQLMKDYRKLRFRRIKINKKRLGHGYSTISLL